uniref:PiggyBac transposable element-derived protein domain-containing protein n=1 Tax=Graphocephala atropunctata TaxID=36148 RepID=A0A1B6MI17_9HEMI
MDKPLVPDDFEEILFNEISDVDSNHDSDVHSNVSGDFENYVTIEELFEEEGQYIEQNEDVDETENGNIVGLDVAGEWTEWSEGDGNFYKFIWTQVSGCKLASNDKPSTPLEFFQLFFTDSLLIEIVKETNRYAAEKIQKNTPLQKKSVWWSWIDLTISELKAFLGVIINMGMNGKPEMTDYFSTNWVDYQPFFKDVFSKERFMQIFWNLHICPPPSGPVAGTLTRSGKVRNVASYLDKKFREHYVPEKEVSVDESTVGFKGRIVFKVYNKDKPIKWGIKVFVLSESSTGYICAIEPYFGKITTDRLDRPDLGVTSRIVLHLVNKLKQSYGNIEGLHVFTDRWYTNMDLAAELLEWKVYLTGTIMLNRSGLPAIVKPQRKNVKKQTPKLKLQQGDIKTFRKDEKFSLLLWKDKKVVSVLSTLYGDNTTQTVRRLKRDNVVEEVRKPTVICKYNKSMGGVDLADHYISSYSFTRKSIKWWRKVFFWLLETAIVNSFVLYNANQNQQHQVRQRCYRKMLIKELVGEVRNVKKRGRPSNSVDDERLNGKLHLPYPLQTGKTKDCSVCSDRRPGMQRKRTNFFCKTCTNNPGLHIGECFEKYHSNKKIKEQ